MKSVFKRVGAVVAAAVVSASALSGCQARKVGTMEMDDGQGFGRQGRTVTVYQRPFSSETFYRRNGKEITIERVDADEYENRNHGPR
jgi:hypothetical protein